MQVDMILSWFTPSKPNMENFQEKNEGPWKAKTQIPSQQTSYTLCHPEISFITSREKHNNI